MEGEVWLCFPHSGDCRARCLQVVPIGLVHTAAHDAVLKGAMLRVQLADAPHLPRRGIRAANQLAERHVEVRALKAQAASRRVNVDGWRHRAGSSRRLCRPSGRTRRARGSGPRRVARRGARHWPPAGQRPPADLTGGAGGRSVLSLGRPMNVTRAAVQCQPARVPRLRVPRWPLLPTWMEDWPRLSRHHAGGGPSGAPSGAAGAPAAGASPAPPASSWSSDAGGASGWRSISSSGSVMSDRCSGRDGACPMALGQRPDPRPVKPGLRSFWSSKSKKDSFHNYSRIQHFGRRGETTPR